MLSSDLSGPRLLPPRNLGMDLGPAVQTPAHLPGALAFVTAYLRSFFTFAGPSPPIHGFGHLYS